MPKKASNVRLFNMLFRHQVYLEGVKASFAVDYTSTLRLLYEAFAKYLSQVHYTTLDQLSKSELVVLIRKFQDEQVHFYNAYGKRLVDLLKQFTNADLFVTQAIFQDVTGKEPDNKTGSQLWASILTEPNPANGLLISDQVKQFLAVATGVIVAALRQGYANAWTVAQVLQIMAVQGGLLGRLAAQNNAMNSTILQHVSSSLQAEVASVFYDRYQWVAILDNRTTVICRSRNGTIYIYGQGPLPPAHYFCRSKAVPVTGDSGFQIPKTYYDWLVEQSTEFQNDVLGSSQAGQLRSGQLTARSFEQIHTVRPLTIDEFKSKIKYILGD